jgi:hypothetical protein
MLPSFIRAAVHSIANSLNQDCTLFRELRREKVAFGSLLSAAWLS